jgi:integrase
MARRVAPSRQESRRLIDVARTKPAWQVARLAAVLASNATMRAGEIRGLQWQDINLVEKTHLRAAEEITLSNEKWSLKADPLTATIIYNLVKYISRSLSQILIS